MVGMVEQAPMMIEGMKVLLDDTVTTRNRPWWERLFSLPWRPSQKTEPQILVLDGPPKTLIMSRAAYSKVINRAKSPAQEQERIEHP